MTDLFQNLKELTMLDLCKISPEQAAKRINSLILQVEKCESYIKKMQENAINDITKERKRWAKADLSAIEIHNLEQQAKGLEDFAQSLMFRGCLENSFNKYDADEAAIELRSQAKALKEQVKL